MANENDDRSILQDLYYSIHVTLGGTGVEVELHQDDYNYAFAEALRTYRSMASKSVRMGYCFMELVPGQTTYSLPKNIDTVIEVHRTKTGFIPGNGQFEPFSAAFIQQTIGAGASFGGLVNFEIVMGYQELLQRMFGGHIMFEFRRSKNELFLWHSPRAEETIALHCSELKSPDELLHDQLVFNILRKYTEGRCRVILGEKYSKPGTVPGPQGGITLKGDALKQGGEELMKAAVEDILDFVDGGTGGTAPFIG